MKRAQLAINSISTTQQDLPEALLAYARAGFPYVEFHLPLVKNWLAQGHTLDEVRNLLVSHNIRAIGGFESHVDCFSASEVQAANHELFIANAQLIHAWGGGTLVFGTDGPATPRSDALYTIARTLKNLLPHIEKLNVHIALEFNWSPVVKSLMSAVQVVKEVNHPQLGILFDPAHYHTTVTKFEHLTVETVALIKHVHLNDMRDKPGEHSNCNSDRVLPGVGILPLHALIAKLDEHGYSGLYSIEMFNEELWQLPAMVAAEQCYQSLLSFCEA